MQMDEVCAALVFVRRELVNPLSVLVIPIGEDAASSSLLVTLVLLLFVYRLFTGEQTLLGSSLFILLSS